ncbi:MAG: hypothetical protein AAB686_02760 [Patescibacteria group bacterium]
MTRPVLAKFLNKLFAPFRVIFRGFSLLTRARSAFTVLELVIFSAIFALAAVSFITILISVTRVQVRQGAAAEVNQQSQFLLQTLQRYIEQSVMVDVASDAPTTNLKLRMAAAYDPTYLYLENGRVYLQETDSGTPEPLTSARVRVTDLSFVKRVNPSGHDSVNLSFALEYVAPTPEQRFMQALRTSVSRVNAATFDSNVIPSTGNIYKLGVSAGDWQSINNTIFFNGSNMGVGVSAPNAKLQVSDGDIYVDTVTPTLRGIILRSPNGFCWRITPTNAGVLTTASTTCP